MKEEIEKDKEFKEAYNYCIFLLSKRDYSKFKIRRKLNSRKYDENKIEAVIQKLVNQEYLREEAYTRMRIKTLLLKGFSNYYITKKLSEEKITIENEQIDQMRDENDISTENSLEYLVHKKLRNKSIPEEFEEKAKLKNKVLRFLISKGHGFQDSMVALDNYLKKENI